MIEPQLGGDGKRLPSPMTLGERQKDFFFHANVAEKPGTKWRIGLLINTVSIGNSLLKQSFESPVVFHKKVCDRSGLFFLLWFHPLPPIMSSDSPTPAELLCHRCHPLKLTSICTGIRLPTKMVCKSEYRGGEAERWCRRRHHDSSGRDSIPAGKRKQFHRSGGPAAVTEKELVSAINFIARYVPQGFDR